MYLMTLFYLTIQHWLSFILHILWTRELWKFIFKKLKDEEEEKITLGVILFLFLVGWCLVSINFISGRMGDFLALGNNTKWKGGYNIEKIKLFTQQNILEFWCFVY